jgi:hypothetical protein
LQILTDPNAAATAINSIVTPWPATSSATIMPGSFLPVAAVTAGAYRTQAHEPAIMKNAMKYGLAAGHRYPNT